VFSNAVFSAMHANTMGQTLCWVCSVNTAIQNTVFNTANLPIKLPTNTRKTVQ
jgi:hypothetical protein